MQVTHLSGAETKQELLSEQNKYKNITSILMVCQQGHICFTHNIHHPDFTTLLGQSEIKKSHVFRFIIRTSPFLSHEHISFTEAPSQHCAT